MRVNFENTGASNDGGSSGDVGGSVNQRSNNSGGNQTNLTVSKGSVGNDSLNNNESEGRNTSDSTPGVGL